MFERLVLALAIIAFVVALVSTFQQWHSTIIEVKGQYSLRWLFVPMAIGPPVLAMLWTNGDYIVKSVNSVATARPMPRPSPPPPPLRRMSGKPADAWQEQYSQDMEAINRVAIFAAGIFFSMSVAMTAGAFYKSRSWKRPPRPSPLTWVALFMSLLAVAAFAVFVFTLPNDTIPQDPFGGS
jgi:hypothetical protein